MNRRVDAHVARTQFGQLMDRAVRKNERFVVDRHGEPSVVILSVRDYLDSVKSAPDWLRKACTEAGKRGVDRLKMKRTDAQIDVYRPEKLATGK